MYGEKSIYNHSNILKFQVCVSVRDHENGNEYLWTRNKFLNRQVHMQELYQQFDETGEIPTVSTVSYTSGKMREFGVTHKIS